MHRSCFVVRIGWVQMTWTVRFKPVGKGRWIDLSGHPTEETASRAWFGWMMVIPYPHSYWIVEMTKTTEPANPWGFAPDDGRNPKTILEGLEGRGVKLAIDGDNLRKVEGTLTAADVVDIKACKPELFMLLWKREHKPAPEPWNDKDAGEFLTNAQSSFKGFWSEIEHEGVIDLAKLRAAGAILCDSLAMLADAQRDRDMDEFKRVTLYVKWLCNHVRYKLR